MTKYTCYDETLEKRLKQTIYQHLRAIFPLDESHLQGSNEPTLNLSSSDPLSLSLHPHVKSRAIEFVTKWGAGSDSSRPILNQIEKQKSIESALAKLLNYEATLLLNTHMSPHQILLPALCNSRSIVFVDQDVQPTIHSALSSSKANVYKFDHNNLVHLEQLIEQQERQAFSSKWIITESCFHHDASSAPIKNLGEIARANQCLLYVDDTLLTGTGGKSGLSLAAQSKEPDLIVGTFGKTCGSFGNFAALSNVLKEYVLECTHISSLPPSALGAIEVLLELIPYMDAERQQLSSLCVSLKRNLLELGWKISGEAPHMFCLVLSSPSELAQISEILSEARILTKFTRGDVSTLRLQLNTSLTKEKLSYLLDTLKTMKRRPLSLNR